jgi:MHS family alpha-ketoglutarate permease-like MFS transporter
LPDDQRPRRAQAGDDRLRDRRDHLHRADLHALETTTSPWAAFALVMASLVMVTGYTSINAVVKAELFPSHIRALGVALPFALANTIFGGTAEYVALWLKDAGHERYFYYYVATMIGVSLIAYITMRETKTTSRIDLDDID